MPRRTAELSFSALRLEGGLLPPDQLMRIAQQAAPWQSDADYGLEPGLKLKDELGRYWTIARARWQRFREQSQLNPQESHAPEWMEALLERVFGFQLEAASPVAKGDRSFPITHTAFGGTVPLVLCPSDCDLDRAEARFGQEGRRRSPHGLLQEYLNASDDCSWGIVSNGRQLRILRDNPSLVRPAYLEADLALLFEDEIYADFSALWLVLQSSRFAPRSDRGCVLEVWRQEAIATGDRILGQLRLGVARAMEQLANGFLRHRDNSALRQALLERQFSLQDFHQELLWLIYRFLFLFVVEDRGLLLHPEASEAQRQVYQEGYSLDRLRQRSLLRGLLDRRYHDLWEGQRLVWQQLRSPHSPLGLPALGGLFALNRCPQLEAARLDNAALLQAIAAIAFFQSDGSLTRVNYRDLNTEELGSVYESLLELHPHISSEGTRWTFSFLGGSGSDRKTSGSYYTPDALVQALIKSALEPVIAEKLTGGEGSITERLLSIRVLDPACGSGHFLLAAARRLAQELARLRAGDDQPDERLRQHCLREVVRRCIYGVDRNPQAVELCKVALWIETVEPGKPLTFLDAHIVCGDSLVGLMSAEALEAGIPDEAYKPLTGDDKAICKALKQENTKNRGDRSGERAGLQRELSLFGQTKTTRLAIAEPLFEAMPEETLAEVTAKAAAYAEWQQQATTQQQRLLADLYTAAFFAPKTVAGREAVPLTRHLRQLEVRGELPSAVRDLTEQLARRHRFLHWHLTFAEVMQAGGFEVLLGNPPWEVSQLNDVEFFASRSPSITKLTGAKRKQAIAELQDSNPVLWEEFETAKRGFDCANSFCRSGRFPLAAQGKLNTYALFSELFLQLLNTQGRAGVIVPTGIATDDSTKAYFDAIASQGRLASLHDFENREAMFLGVHRAYKFALLTLAAHIKATDFVFFATAIEQLADSRRHFTLSAEDIALINPNTRTCPVFRSQMDAEITKKIYQRVPVFINEVLGDAGNPWDAHCHTRLFNMTEDSHLFFNEPAADRLPLYEAKLIHQFDHRWATYESDGSSRDMTLAEKADPSFSVTPRYWVSQQEVKARLRAQNWSRPWLMGWRDITNTTNERTSIASVIGSAGIGNTISLLFSSLQPDLLSCFLANWNSLVLDFTARNKIGGTHLTYSYLKQFPFLPPNRYDAATIEFIQPRVLELTYTSHDLQGWANDLGYDGAPFIFDRDRRALLRAELDAYYAHLYGLSRDELRYILDPADVMGPDYPSETFRVLKDKELKQYGEYRTRRLVLEAWDRLFK